MNRFSSLFGNNAKPNPVVSDIAWNFLETQAQFNDLIVASEMQPVLIFKHSTRCGISRMALKQFEKDFKMQDTIAPYFLDLLEHRNISNAIAEQLGVVHQSPQLIVIKAGQVVHAASHGGIDGGVLEEWV